MLFAISSCETTGSIKRKIVKLPHAEPSYKIVSDEDVNEQLHADIFLNLRFMPNGENYWIPSTINGALEELKMLLPPDVYRALMQLYVEQGKPTNIKDIRWSLSNFLVELWDIDNSIIGEKLYCLGVFENNFTPLWLLMAHNYSEFNTVNIKITYHQDIKALEALVLQCEQRSINR